MKRYMLVVTKAQLGWLARQKELADVGFEIRLDSFSKMPDFKAIRAMTQAPLLATFRSQPHCGMALAKDRSGRGWAWRQAALNAGFEGVDVELDEPEVEDRLAVIRAAGGFSVVSHHETQGGADLTGPLKRALQLNADVTKIIGTGAALEDFAAQRQAYERAQTSKLVFFYMGGEYAASRWLSLKYGAPFTFVMPDDAAQVAPGVPSLDQAQNGYAMVSDRTYSALFAVVGTPIGHSQSPNFHNPLLRETNPEALFLAVPAHLGELASVLAIFPECRGLAVTKPLKEEAFAFADTYLDAAVQGLGAINTLVRQKGQWLGANTDFSAMKAMLADVPQGSILRILGYGGLGKAVVQAGLQLGLQVEVTNRSQARLKDLDARAKAIPWQDRHQNGPQVIVQATSVGMAPGTDASPLDEIPASVESLIETIYNPRKTVLLEMALSRNLKTHDGLALFQKQAEIQNAIFKRVSGDASLS